MAHILPIAHWNEGMGYWCWTAQDGHILVRVLGRLNSQIQISQFCC